MKIVITGAYGQLGNEMRAALQRYPQTEALFTDADTLDICDKAAVSAFFATHRPDALVNCAAYTAVDKAEEDAAMCFKINSEAVRNLGEVAASRHMRMVHISTDYVFNGINHKPYTEEDAVCPTNVYGQSKCDGEQKLLAVCPEAVIIRTSWLYSSYGNNFVKTMLRLGQTRDSLDVIFDQIGTPTYAADLAEAIAVILHSENVAGGIFHFSNEGVCSWFDFAYAIFQEAGITCRLQPVESSAYPVRTPRPHYSVLNKKKIKQTYQLVIPHWSDGLKRMMNLLNNDCEQ
ncbi:MAG: dTDP-4-dehydrorhamnose reductase [Prevotellaceae bacterium]|jgi:dTDP-4-dehydrorhamnose reductase|nr:dTDP-4-dehydrorhamnose reductase [Prevotellaceae bacterium]